MRNLAIFISFLLGSSPAWALDQEAPASGTAPAVAEAAPERPMLSQGDPAWRNVPIVGNVTIGRAGCLLVSLLDVGIALGLQVSGNPAEFARLLARNGLFTRSGLLQWNLSRVLPIEARRLTLSGSAAFSEAVQRLGNGARVLLQVVTPRGTMHWVVASRVVNGDLEIRDPNGGRVSMLGSLYGRNALRGLAVITMR